jgi:outer membrane lipopolysaccharide assembly protein LptE/RlpB
MRSAIRRRNLKFTSTALLLGILGLGMLATAGCGYTLVGRASNLPEDVRQVYIQPLENRTSRSQVEQILTQAITDELVTRQRFTVLNSRAGADAEIRGAVVGYAATPVTFDQQTGRAQEYEISLIVQVIFQRIPANEDEEPEVLWRNDRYQFRESYPVEAGQEAYFDREDQTIEEVSRRLAETMVSDLLEGF